jgi:hypothetical protein
VTGQPFEWEAADALTYDFGARDIARQLRDGNLAVFKAYFDALGAGDTGYYSYLGILYYLTGDSIIISRLLKALYSAVMCLLIYKLTKRNFGEETGRIAGILCMLMPHFMYYCGLHLKETEMVFLTVAFIERTDYLLRNKNYNVVNIAIPILLAGSLFFFRTVLGATALMAFLTTIVFSAGKVVGWGKRIMIGIWAIAAIGYFMGGQISMEVEQHWENREDNQRLNMEQRTQRGNVFARYGSTVIFAPMIFAAPFPTLVNTENQENMRLTNGSMFVKNITAFFTMLGIFLLIYRRQWREHIIILAFLIGYLAVIAMSAFAISDRFHFPSVPFALIIAAYGISQMTNQNKKYFNWWTILIFVIIVGWSWFKLAGRGMV